MHLLFTPNHVQLLNSCYPPASALLTAGPNYSPNTQELSRLTYYASNHPSKLTKLGNELEKRLRAECRKAQAGNLRYRASLLMTLAIFRSLTTECRRDIALLSPSLVASVNVTLSALPTDLEVVTRAASVFTAWTTYTDGHLIGTDSNMTTDYLLVLDHFASLSSSSPVDEEVKNRTRLIGFAALTGALNSEALYSDTAQFRAQVSRIMRPILGTLFQTEIAMLDEQAAAVKDATISIYLAEFRTRPATERRAASIHIHVDGDNGPSMADVSNASLCALFSLLGHANGSQIGYIMHSSFDSLDQLQGWTSLDHCCWFARKAVEWSQYQYRYAVPTWLVERLHVSQEMAPATPLHTTLLAMVTTVFNSPTPLINLSTSDIMSNLVTLLLRRTTLDPNDSLIPALVECISSLGRHVYYSDQIQDLAGELISRLVVIEAQDVRTLGRGKTGSTHSRWQAVRCLLAGLLGLIQAANKTDLVKSEEEAPAESTLETSRKDGGQARPSRRSRISPDIWHDTLSLLCCSDYSVRTDYTEALVFYISNEMPKHGNIPNSDGIKRTRWLAEGPLQQAMNMTVLLHAGDVGTKFLNAVHAYMYILSTTSSLGLSTSSSTSPSQSVVDDSGINVIPSTPTELETVRKDSHAQSQSPGRRSFSVPYGPRSRKASVVQRLLDGTASGVSASTSACLADYAHVLNILTTIHEQLPVRGLLTGIPMLLALDASTNPQDADDFHMLHRITVIKEVIARVWLVVGRVWNSSDVMDITEKALSSMPTTTNLPEIPPFELGSYTSSRGAVGFPPEPTGITPWSGVSSEAVLEAITCNKSVQEATGLDRQGLLRRFSATWTADAALRDSVEKTSIYENSTRGDGISPLLKISPALMHIENISLQSLAKSVRGVGVTDLREALEGRSSMSISNPALARPPSISTLEHAPSSTGIDNLRLSQTRSRSRTKKHSLHSGSGDVRDVLNRLGIGKQNGSLLKASFPQKISQRSA